MVLKMPTPTLDTNSISQLSDDVGMFQQPLTQSLLVSLALRLTLVQSDSIRLASPIPFLSLPVLVLASAPLPLCL